MNSPKSAIAGIEYKRVAFELKDVQSDGTFTGYAACFNNVDSDNDKILPGAFTDSLAASGPGCPILWQHDQKEPIGVNEKATQDDHGLAVQGQLVLEVRRAAEGYALLKKKAIKGLSIGYRVLDYSYEGGVRLLKKLQLMEYSLVTFPANSLAQVDHVKGLNRYRTRQEHNNHGRDIEGAIEEVLSNVYRDRTTTAAEKKAAITKNIDQYRKAMTDWHCQNIEFREKDDESQDLNSLFQKMAVA